jgi:hypothetical protein
VKKRDWLPVAVIVVVTCGIFAPTYGEAAPQTTVPEFIQQAQTVHIPVVAVHRETALPIGNLTASDFTLDIDGQPRPFEFSKSGTAQDRPNLLIILPLGAPLNRNQALNQTIADLDKQPPLGWNISILDDNGNQTPYTRDLKTTIADLKNIEAENPADIALPDWRVTATLAIASMRDLPGRRVVMTLGDIFHEVLIDRGELAYEAFQVNDVATAARNAGAVIYAADSADEIERLRGLAPYFSVAGNGPWLLVSQNGHMAGWISNSVSDTIDQIRRDAASAYEINLHLDLKQMDGQLHVISITPHQPETILNAPPYYVAPSLAQLNELSKVSPALRQALRNPPAASSSPLELATQLAYFPHRDGKTGTQIATTGYFWTKTTPPPKQVETALQLEQTSSGFLLNTTVGSLQWSSAQPVWNTAIDVGPGAYLLRVAAADATGKITAAVDTPFTVEPTTEDAVMISSLVLGKTCVFAPPPPQADATPEAAAPSHASVAPNSMDYLRAGDCDLEPDPTHQYTPQDVVWTLVRITPTGKLSDRPSKDWKASFVLMDDRESKLAEEPVRWLTAEDGSFVATTAFLLENPKLKLANGDYAIVFRLKGPGIERDYGEDDPFTVYGVQSAP